ncbi:MAG: A24 family peptidase [Methylobacter sp.]|nr:A24 family peptidase [Methylobacter sp.]MDP2429888.1 A24 family peptidase [Methylobacter sp.]MDP3056075.1 A24 family peptidase [Methylobacter sp.]MDP3362845.1 A24 family peptidase [Methylobacter sp.]MDZ4219869.1 A24 family peptidase [Methylobacter sp.]
MQQLDTLLNNAVLFSALAGVVGLLVGSFLNVVIYRLPIMMQRGWQKECSDYLQLSPESESGAEDPFNLVLPLSRCPACNTPIKPHQNIPLISYIFLKGRCAACGNPISLRYPAIEVLTAAASIAVAWHFGYGAQAFFALLLTWSLIALIFIDIDHQLLPDSITLPMLWLGLGLSVFNLFTDAHAGIIGAIAGYLALWSIFHLFKLATGKEGIGYGDFKLLALFGAWLGWQYLPIILLLSSLVGAVIGVGMIVFVKHDRNVPIPFGPYLAVAGWIALLWGDSLNQLYLSTVGL